MPTWKMVKIIENHHKLQKCMTTTNCIHAHLQINVPGTLAQDIKGNAQCNVVFAGNKNMNINMKKKSPEKLKGKSLKERYKNF